MFQKWSFYVEVILFVRNSKIRCKEGKIKLWSHNWNESDLWKPNVNILEKPNNILLFLGQVKSHLYGLVLNILWFATPKLLLPLEEGNSTFLKLTDVVRATYILVFIEIL